MSLLRGSASSISARTLWTHIDTRRKNMCFHGAVLAFFFISAVTTFIMGILGLIRINTDPDGRMNFDIFTYTLPFVAFIFDHSSKRILNLGEKSVFVLMKILFIIYYLGAYVLALQ
jgi:hypothetical protein